MEPEQAEAAIKILKSGNFVDVDFIHKGSGRAFLLEYPDGSKVLRFEDFNITNGPDLFVYLAETTAPTGDLEGLGNYIDLGRLKGNAGNQNYELPAGIGNFNSVVIWCKKFGVLFPYAVMH
ncbi:MAG: DM13 domain-containing protein [Candidatus Yanofskybacteria bacterium]|nr:DM13 domain-containing protein [Candidatus Yanofskybacteria bacterium]